MPPFVAIANWLLLGCLGIFGVVWIVAARFAHQDKQRQPLGARGLQIALYLVAALLLWGPPRLPLGPLRFVWVAASDGAALVSVALAAGGVGFAIWARVTLGRNWSGRVTLKAGHQLIEAGPYAIVRHPIYTGVLMALLGAAVSRGTLAGLLGVLVQGSVFASKIVVEERLLASEFGPAFADYRRRVKALIPLVL